MKGFLKEIFILSFIIIFIIGLDLVTDKIMKDTIEEIGKNVNCIESKIEQENVKDDVKKLKNDWKEKEDLLSCFSEHNELDKITTQIISLEENLNNKIIVDAKENIAQIKFLLSHIEEKQKLALKNIL